MACYFCGQHIPRNEGYRRYVTTGRSTGVSFGRRITPSVRTYQGIRTLCKGCAEALDAAEKQKACFVVTATMENPDHLIVCDMRKFRDEVLKENRIGISFIDWYYTHGPKLAAVIAHSSFRRKVSYYFIVLPAYILVKLWLRFK